MVQTSSPLVRTIGVLLHPTALPESPVCGSFGAPSRDWLLLLARNGISVWQFLPLAPTDSNGSPYSSPSSFALNPWFLDAKDLVEEGFLRSEVIDQLPSSTKHNSSLIDFTLAEERSVILGKALINEWETQPTDRRNAFHLWCAKQSWLEDHVSFMELRRQNDGSPWWEWPKELASYQLDALQSWKAQNDQNLLEHRLLQWHLDRQWQALKTLAREVGVLLFGDLPFYVSRDSADVWSNRSLFSINSGGDLDIQSGVPPDYFSNTGQLWGTPVFLWEIHSSNQFSWWRSRVARQLEQVDLLRLDHFRALSAYWAVPGDKTTAEDGEWKLSPGAELLTLLREDCEGNLPLVAEDLGVVTPEVENLRDQFGLFGMKILQFAFDGDSNNPYLPENIRGNSWVVYTGTHDNQTTIGWWESLDDESRKKLEKRFNSPFNCPAWRLIDLGLATQAGIVVAPIQDLLSLGDIARFNTPGTVGTNWQWRLKSYDDAVVNSLESYGERGVFWGRSFVGASKLLERSSNL